MTNEALSTWLQNLLREVEQTNQRYPKNLVQGWPIPFFGDILGAQVLTVGVNPSDKEFRPNRDWDQVAKLEDWEGRLLGYFQKRTVPPWIWFETWSICLALLDLGYTGNGAAHIDISPRPTTPMLDEGTDKKEFRDMVEHDVKWFFELLSNLPQVQLLLVAGPIPRADGTKQQLADFIQEQAGAHESDWRRQEPLPRLITSNHPQGIPVLICPYEPKVDGLYAMVRHVYRNRALLRRLVAPRVSPVPLMPAQLDWSSTIGNFITNFGMLDLHVQDFLESLLPAAEFLKFKERPFYDCVELIKQRLSNPDCTLSNKAEFEQFFRRLDRLRETRNHIAHGILRLGLASDQKTFVQTLSLPKDLSGSETSARHLEFAKLQSELKTLNELIEEFDRLAGFKTSACVPIAGNLK